VLGLEEINEDKGEAGGTVRNEKDGGTRNSETYILCHKSMKKQG
jgi:hypothetical protein